jgi:mRNA degradation ribonuclease J1/J2
MGKQMETVEDHWELSGNRGAIEEIITKHLSALSIVFMKITIHRGINQIGGCITEIATNNNCILIDLGQNLPDNEGNIEDNLANPQAIKTLTNGVDAIFYTHYHGDHVELYRYVPVRRLPR